MDAWALPEFLDASELAGSGTVFNHIPFVAGCVEHLPVLPAAHGDHRPNPAKLETQSPVPVDERPRAAPSIDSGAAGHRTPASQCPRRTQMSEMCPRRSRNGHRSRVASRSSALEPPEITAQRAIRARAPNTKRIDVPGCYCRACSRGIGWLVPRGYAALKVCPWVGGRRSHGAGGVSISASHSLPPELSNSCMYAAVLCWGQVSTALMKSAGGR